jgi:hypothetical protein
MGTEHVVAVFHSPSYMLCFQIQLPILRAREEYSGPCETWRSIDSEMTSSPTGNAGKFGWLFGFQERAALTGCHRKPAAVVPPQSWKF